MEIKTNTPAQMEKMIDKQWKQIKKLKADLREVKKEKRSIELKLATKVKQLERSERQRQAEYDAGSLWHQDRDALQRKIKTLRAERDNYQGRVNLLEHALTFDPDEIWKIEDYSRLRQQNKDLLSEKKRLDDVNYHLCKENNKLRKYLNVYTKGDDSNDHQ